MIARPRHTIWWRRLSPLGRFLVLAATTPLVVANAWALDSIFHYFHSLVIILTGASLLAFLLNYPVTWMVDQGAKRQRACVMVFLLALSLALALGVTLIPIVFAQSHQLLAHLPEWIDSGRHQLLAFNDYAKNAGLPINLDALTLQLHDRLKTELQVIAGRALSLAVITVSSLLDLLLTVVLTFYLLQHGDRLWQSLIDWLPKEMQEPFSRTLRLSFQNFFLGQMILSTCMASALILVFLLLRVPFGFLFGLTIGTMALIPLGGTVGIALVTLLVTLQNVVLGLKVLGSAFIVQQILENGIAPRVLGHMTGLNPVWVLVSVLTGARVGGLLGVFLAVPIAGVIKSALTAYREIQTPFESSLISPIQPPMVVATEAANPEAL